MTVYEDLGLHTLPSAGLSHLASQLSLEQKIGQLLMIAFLGPSLESDVSEFIAEAGIGGVLLFGHNLQSPWQSRDLTSALQSHAAMVGLPPLLVAVDQEGGSVSRLRFPITAVPSPLAIAATGDTANAARIASILAAELRDLGLNLNLSAVVDVNTQARNPVIGNRAYGDTPEVVSAFARAAIAAHHANGVLVAAKHFPGHGDTVLDSHRDLPSVAHDWSRMRIVELPPFVAAVHAGADAILTAHVVYPGIDPSGHPGTLSRFLIEEILRQEMGFKGIVISDAIEMNAIAGRYGQVEGALLALEAGADVVLTIGRLEEQKNIHRALFEAVHGGRIPEQRVDEALHRVLLAKSRLPSKSGNLRSVAASADAWPRQEHQVIARQIARESITVVRDNGNLLPFNLDPTRRLGVIEFRSTHLSPVEEGDTLNLLDLLVRTRHGNTATLLVDSSFASSRASASAFTAGCDLLIIATRDAVLDVEQARLSRELLACGVPSVLLALRSPYDLIDLPEADCYVATFGDQACSLEAAVGVLFGDFTPSGQLPVCLK